MSTRPRIEARIGARPEACTFQVEGGVNEGPAVLFGSAADAAGSPLAERLFALPGVCQVVVADGRVTVARETYEGWGAAARQVAEAIWEHLESGRPAVSPQARDRTRSSEAVEAQVRELLDAEVNPAVAMHGGFIELVGFQDYVAYLRMGGGCQGCGAADMTLRQGVERMLRERVPELVAVADVTDHAAGTNPFM